MEHPVEPPSAAAIDGLVRAYLGFERSRTQRMPVPGSRAVYTAFFPGFLTMPMLLDDMIRVILVQWSGSEEDEEMRVEVRAIRQLLRDHGYRTMTEGARFYVLPMELAHLNEPDPCDHRCSCGHGHDDHSTSGWCNGCGAQCEATDGHYPDDCMFF
jgi:hypothetical protein